MPHIDPALYKLLGLILDRQDALLFAHEAPTRPRTRPLLPLPSPPLSKLPPFEPLPLEPLPFEPLPFEPLPPILATTKPTPKAFEAFFFEKATKMLEK